MGVALGQVLTNKVSIDTSPAILAAYPGFPTIGVTALNSSATERWLNMYYRKEKVKPDNTH